MSALIPVLFHLSWSILSRILPPWREADLELCQPRGPYNGTCNSRSLNFPRDAGLLPDFDILLEHFNLFFRQTIFHNLLCPLIMRQPFLWIIRAASHTPCKFLYLGLLFALNHRVERHIEVETWYFQPPLGGRVVPKPSKNALRGPRYSML